MKTFRDFLRRLRKTRTLLRWAKDDWKRDPAMPDILGRMAQTLAGWLFDPEPGSVEDARRALKSTGPLTRWLRWQWHGGNGTRGRG